MNKLDIEKAVARALEESHGLDRTTLIANIIDNLSVLWEPPKYDVKVSVDNKLNITNKSRVQLNDLIDMIADAKCMSHIEVIDLIPQRIFEGDFYFRTEDHVDFYWCKELVQYLYQYDIESIEIYQNPPKKNI
jgi:hypothetical protein